MPAEPFRHPVRVYYEDTDCSGVVYHAAYLRYFERARSEWVRALGVNQETLRESRGLAFTVADLCIEFKRPARLDDDLEATVVVAEHKRASIVFEQALHPRGRPETILARARVRVACVDVLNFKPCALPDEFRKE